MENRFPKPNRPRRFVKDSALEDLVQRCISPIERDALRAAVCNASEWRGSLVGSGDDDESIADEAKRLTEFDAYIRNACNALRRMGLRVPRGTEHKD
jgi:hypothetical protein